MSFRQTPCWQKRQILNRCSLSAVLFSNKLGTNTPAARLCCLPECLFAKHIEDPSWQHSGFAPLQPKQFFWCWFLFMLRSAPTLTQGHISLHRIIRSVQIRFQFCNWQNAQHVASCFISIAAGSAQFEFGFPDDTLEFHAFPDYAGLVQTENTVGVLLRFGGVRITQGSLYDCNSEQTTFRFVQIVRKYISVFSLCVSIYVLNFQKHQRTILHNNDATISHFSQTKHTLQWMFVTVCHRTLFK